jgi:hypothetical protein
MLYCICWFAGCMQTSRYNPTPHASGSGFSLRKQSSRCSVCRGLWNGCSGRQILQSLLQYKQNCQRCHSRAQGQRRQSPELPRSRASSRNRAVGDCQPKTKILKQKLKLKMQSRRHLCSRASIQRPLEPPKRSCLRNCADRSNHQALGGDRGRTHGSQAPYSNYDSTIILTLADDYLDSFG